MGRVALVVGLVPLLIVAEQGRTWGWGSPAPFACYVIGVVGVVAFIFIERRMGDDALMPLRLFRHRGLRDRRRLQSSIIGIGMFGGIDADPALPADRARATRRPRPAC